MSADDTIIIFEFSVNDMTFYCTKRVQAAENLEEQEFIKSYFKDLKKAMFTTNFNVALHHALKLEQECQSEYGVKMFKSTDENVENYIRRTFLKENVIKM